MVLWGLFGEADRSTKIDASTIDEGMIQVISKSVQKCMTTTSNSQFLSIDCNSKPPEMIKYCRELTKLIADTSKTSMEAARLLGEVNKGLCGCVVNNITQDMNATVNTTCILENDLTTEIEANLINAFENKEENKEDILSKAIQSFSGDDMSKNIIAPVINRSNKVVDKSAVQEGIQSITNAQTLTINGGFVSNITQRAVSQTIYATMLKNKNFSKLVADLKNMASNQQKNSTQPVLCTVFGMGCDLSNMSQILIFAMIAIVLIIMGYLYIKSQGGGGGRSSRSSSMKKK